MTRSTEFEPIIVTRARVVSLSSGRLAAERDSDGTLYRYVFAPDGTPLAVERTTPGASADIFSYHTDAQGSVVALTDAGIEVASYRYDAFGAVTSVTGSDPIAARNPLRYRAYYHDTSTGLYYLPARYYDPATARFLSRDPAPPHPADPLTLNRYTYCAGDPVNSYDPTGAVADVEWGAWDYYYNHDPATKGDRTAAAARTAQTHAGANTRRAEAAAREAQARAAAMRERQMQEATRDATLDRVQNGLATISALASVAGTLSLCAGAATAPTVAGPIALTGLAGFLFLTSVVASGANVLITPYRHNTGYLDSKTATVSAGLSIVGMVPVVGDGAAIGGALMEWEN